MFVFISVAVHVNYYPNFGLFQKPQKTLKMKIPTLSVLSVFALLGMALAMGGYGYGGYGASYMPVPVHYGAGSGHGGAGEGGLCK